MEPLWQVLTSQLLTKVTSRGPHILKRKIEILDTAAVAADSQGCVWGQKKIVNWPFPVSLIGAGVLQWTNSHFPFLDEGPPNLWIMRIRSVHLIHPRSFYSI